MPESPSLSVVIPTYNRPNYLREALQTVAAQTVTPAEVIVSDNHSTERADSVVREFSSLPIRYIWHKEPMPVDAHWLWALGAATGDWIALLEDDNLWRSWHLAALSEAVTAFPNAGIAASAAIPFVERRRSMHTDVFAPIWAVDLLEAKPMLIPASVMLATSLCGSPIASSTAMLRRDFFESEKPHAAGLSATQDRWLWAQMVSQGGLAFMPRRTVLYREHPQQLARAIDGESYRKQGAATAHLILDLMSKKGIEPAEAFAQLRDWISPEQCDELKIAICRDRDPELIRTLLPLVSDAANRRPLIVEKARAFAALALRKWF